MKPALPFAHPGTRQPLVQKGNEFHAPNGDIFPIRNGIPFFIPQALQNRMENERSGVINGIKTALRKFPRLYVAIIYVISPVCFVGLSAQKFLRRFSDNDVVISIGAGVHDYGNGVVNVDIFPYKNVDIVGDAMALPFLDDSIDGIICEYLIEHVPFPQKVVDEIIRVLKPGGQAYLAAPFVYPFHASPNDYFRWSVEGAKILCKDAIVEKVAPRSGPCSALSAQLGTSAAIAFSFGNEKVYGICLVLFGALFSPVKWLDVFMGRLSTTHHGAGSWYAVIRKPGRNM